VTLPRPAASEASSLAGRDPASPAGEPASPSEASMAWRHGLSIAAIRDLFAVLEMERKDGRCPTCGMRIAPHGRRAPPGPCEYCGVEVG